MKSFWSYRAIPAEILHSYLLSLNIGQIFNRKKNISKDCRKKLCSNKKLLKTFFKLHSNSSVYFVNFDVSTEMLSIHTFNV